MGKATVHSQPTASSGSYPTRDPDRRRMQLLWLALSLVGLLTVAVVLLAAYGLPIPDGSVGEPLLLIGLLAFVVCIVAYFADKEREHRRENRRLIQRLHDTAEALDARVVRLNKLCETSMELTGALDINNISELVVSALVEQVQADAASLVLMDKSKGECVHTHSTGPVAGPDDPSPEAASLAAAAAGDGPEMRDVEASPELVAHLRAWERIRASISAPVRITDMVSGALTAMRARNFEPEDLNLLTTLANMSSKAIESAELHQALRKSYYRALHVLVRSLAARDPYTATHGEAVTWVACRLAQELDLSEADTALLQAYAPLHDLGKIGVADAVLLKPGPLSAVEARVVRQHTAIGEEIIAPLMPGETALAMIRNHHEHWDGGGYPDRLRGEQIPLLARVVAVADAYHAMVSDRSYRSARSPSEAVQELMALAGAQFDPAVVEAMVRLWDRGELARFNMRLEPSPESSDLPDLPSIPIFPTLSAPAGPVVEATR